MKGKICMNNQDKLLEIKRDNMYYIIRYRLNASFDMRDKELINTFCERLKKIRKQRQAEAKKGTLPKFIENRIKWDVENICDYLGLGTVQAYYKLEKADKHEVLPVKHIERLCTFFYVTPHYLLGYTDDTSKSFGYGRRIERNTSKDKIVMFTEKELLENAKDGVFTFTIDDIITKDENNNPKELETVLECLNNWEDVAVRNYAQLAKDDPFLFYLIRNIVEANEQKREKMKKFLHTLVYNI